MARNYGEIEQPNLREPVTVVCQEEEMVPDEFHRSVKED
jgi:hypothetical protein